MKILLRTIIKIVVSFTSFYHFDSFLQIKFFLSSSTPAWYNKKHNLYAFMEFSYTRQRIVNGTTTAHNDTLEEMKARKGTTAAKKAYLSFVNMCAKGEWKISLHIHIVASWIHSPTVSYCSVVIACLRAMLCLYFGPVRSNIHNISHSQKSKRSEWERKLCTNLHVTIICIWQLQPLKINGWDSHRKFLGFRGLSPHSAVG